MGKLEIIKNRLYADYIMPSRLDEYEKLIQELKKNDYTQLTMREFKKLVDENSLQGRYFINRHDIDTDISTAKEFFRIERKYNVKASYYFRLPTLDIDFMKEIEDYGSEASYHFEEIAQYAKDNHIKSREEIFSNLNKIKNIFKENFKNIEKKLGYKLRTVCSHGDFVNRKLNIINNLITEDYNLRKELKIVCETYDKDLMDMIDIYIADKPYPIFYSPSSIFEYIGKKNIICMLTHPRQWRINILVNTFDNIKRVYEGLRW